MEDVLQIREALDELAASIACEQIDEEELEALRETMREFDESTTTAYVPRIAEADVRFHDIIYQAARNQRLVQFVNILQEQLQRFRAASLARPGRSKTALEEHKQIVEALSERNGELASKLAQEHIENAENAMIASMKEKGELEHS